MATSFTHTTKPILAIRKYDEARPVRNVKQLGGIPTTVGTLRSTHRRAAGDDSSPPGLRTSGDYTTCAANYRV